MNIKTLDQLYGIGSAKSHELFLQGVTPSNISQHLTKLPTATRMFIKYKPSPICHHDVPYIISTLRKYDIGVIEITGSWRRNKKIINDIDILSLSPNKMQIAITNLIVLGKWIPLSSGSLKVSGIYKLPKPIPYKYIKIDIWYTTKTQLPYMRLYSTGSYVHNIIMRNIAKKKGYKLTQYGITHISKKQSTIPILTTERQIFKYLNMPYIMPKNR